MRKFILPLLALLGMFTVASADAQVSLSVANEAITGTTIGKLAKFTATNPVTAVIATTSDTDGVVGIVSGFSLQGSTGITGNAYISQVGITNCTFDTSGVTTKHYVIASTAAGGSCADGGASRPTGVQVIGVAQATGGSGASVAVSLDKGFANTAGSGTPANPTATITTSAVNGSASTFMRSDAAPAAPQCSASTFGLCKPDGTTITASSGVITAVGGAATTITPGTTTVVGATAPCVIDNSASTTMGCAAVGTGILTSLGVNVGTAGAPVVNGGVLGTPSSGTGTNITGIVNNNVLAATLATGTSVSLTAPREYYVCTGTCTVTPPVPAAGYEFCVMNDDNVTTVITLAALGSSARYEATARTSYGTAGTGTFVSGGAAGDKVCLLGRDSTHYLTVSFNGTWTAN